MALPKSNPKKSEAMKMKRVADAMKPQKTAMAKRCSALRKKKTNELSKLRRVLAEKSFWEIVEDRKNWDLGIQDDCLGSKLEALNERIGAVMRKMRIVESSVEPEAADQQLPYNGFEFDDYEPTVDTLDHFLSWVLGGDHHNDIAVMEDDLRLYDLDTMLPEEPQQPEQQTLSVQSMDSITSDDDLRLLLSECETGLMQEDLQFCDDDLSHFLAPLETMLLQQPQEQQPIKF
ncbi:unnamed protein product [Prunus armeniaca]|uniref:Uncharacterized protein n=1 Tax=Prunus armeniaca TaxID=36596 RepID=A0A6J5XLS5_PRUAR|nr:hypothetical protein GBA52_027183 [Prunus armeniaca]CAB4313387.1 unnamed protein product [Prunus armeniaca]